MSDLEETINNMIQGEVDNAIEDALANSSAFGDIEGNVDNIQFEHENLREEFETLQQSHEELIARFENLLYLNPHLKEEE